MATPLKDMLGPEVPRAIAAMVSDAEPGFDAEGFLADALEGYAGLELMDRGRHWGRALRRHLPGPDARAIDAIRASLGPVRADDGTGAGMAPFLYLPHSFVIAEHGLDCFEESMAAQHALTQRFTAEFCIRPFLEELPGPTLARLGEWTADPSHHVRRLVSEGTRPRLPWAPRLRALRDDPGPVLDLLERLRDDPSEYVRRSVANNLNDIGKDHPELLLRTCRRWARGAGPERRRLLRHALRSAVRAGDPRALEILGYAPGVPVEVAVGDVIPPRPRVGGSARLAVEIANPLAERVRCVVHARVGFARPRGRTGWKVFSLGEREIAPAETVSIAHRISLAHHTTRTPHPGPHLVEIAVNGAVRATTGFEVAPA